MVTQPDVIGEAREAAGQSRYRETTRLLLYALSAAREHGDTRALLEAGREAVELINLPPQRQLRLAIARELFTVPREGVPPRTLCIFLAFCSVIFLEAQDRSAADEARRQLAAMEPVADPIGRIYILQTSLIPSLLEGRLDEIARAEAQFVARGDELGIPVLGMSFARRLPLQAMLYMGRGDDAIGLVQGESGMTVFRRMYALAYAGRYAEARRLLAEHQQRHQRPIAEEEVTTPVLASLLEVANLVGEKEAAARFAEMLRPAADAALIGVLGFYPPLCISRLLGDAAALLGRPGEARERYEHAVKLAGSIDHGPEIAITRLHLAGLLARHYPGDRALAQKHLGQAMPELRSMGMEPALRQAQALQTRLMQ